MELVFYPLPLPLHEVKTKKCCRKYTVMTQFDVYRIVTYHTYSALCCFCSSSAANAALNYINYPTRVIFRSCKLVPTIIISVLWNRKRYQISELMFGITMSLGMVLFAQADYQISSGISSYGILLVSFSVIADSFLPNFQVEVGFLLWLNGLFYFYDNVPCYMSLFLLGFCHWGFSGGGDVLYQSSVSGTYGWQFLGFGGPAGERSLACLRDVWLIDVAR